MPDSASEVEKAKSAFRDAVDAAVANAAPEDKINSPVTLADLVATVPDGWDLSSVFVMRGCGSFEQVKNVSLSVDKQGKRCLYISAD